MGTTIELTPLAIAHAPEHCQPDSEFYDLLEVSTWQSQRRHPVDEVTVGLRTGNVTRGGVYLPSIVIEARSVGGNRKGCEAFCTALAQEATHWFGVVVLDRSDLRNQGI